MVIKVIGSVLIIFSSCMIGYYQTLKLWQQVRIINHMIVFFTYAKTNVIAARLTFAEILENFKLKEENKFNQVIEYYFLSIGKNKSDVKNVYQLDENLHGLLVSLFNVIAFYSICEIEKVLDEGIRELREYYDVYRLKYKKNRKMFAVLGIFCGVSICILLL
ncbi:stage III sporulation protein AB [Anaerocellum danielii]|uniref:Stage III sporulation protein AB n=1 Tax=Anaerocellum danielii TaxID=1387557 RepID=A0ABZ0U1X1_9FIRM|nr:stage III sporulation protein AB [Caldicellulosiruptor danielii]WPX09717.1 stage III sporulation protein AB [Caldicellulosiruptor danielii]